jgi:hypothetical protein
MRNNITGMESVYVLRSYEADRGNARSRAGRQSLTGCGRRGGGESPPYYPFGLLPKMTL